MAYDPEFEQKEKNTSLSFMGTTILPKSLRQMIDEGLFIYWKHLPEPKMSYSEWWLGKGGFKEMLDTHHKELENGNM